MTAVPLNRVYTNRWRVKITHWGIFDLHIETSKTPSQKDALLLPNPTLDPT